MVLSSGFVIPETTRVPCLGGGWELASKAAAAAVLGCGFLKLSKICPDKEKAARYRAEAIKIAKSLSSDAYFAKSAEIGGFVLKHAVASKPDGTDIDVPLNYGDYYYLELLVKLHVENN